MDNFSIRSYLPEDLPACRKLWVELTDHHRQIYHDPSIGGDDPGQSFDHHLEQAGPQHIWVAVQGQQLVGFVGLLVHGQEAELEPIIVSPAYRDCQAGRLLVDRVLAEAKLLNMHYLSVRPVARNLDAIRFFYRSGFQILGQIELFMDLRQSPTNTWEPGPTIAGLELQI